MARAKRPWAKVVERHGIKIRLFERAGTVYRDVVIGRVPSASGKLRTQHDIKSLAHRNREVAERQAKALAEEIAKTRLTKGSLTALTLGQVFTAYRQHRMLHLKPARAKEAQARIAMFTDAWDVGLNVNDVDQTRVDHYVAKRRSLEILAPGKRVGVDGNRRRGYSKPRRPRDGALDAEFRWLSSVFNWARGFKQDGRVLLSENPLHGIGLEWPKEKNPRRPVASHARYIATLAHANDVDPKGRLRCILTLARYTGRRESAICSIRAGDLLFTEDRIRAALAASGLDENDAMHMPNGAIHWRAETDKEGFLIVSPLSQAARRELDLYLGRNPRLGDVPLFPAPKVREAQIRRETAAAWLLRAEELAEQPKLVGGVFHPYRRLWASERRHLPDADVAAAGGWRSTLALRLSYQRADAATVRRVVEAIG